MTMCSTFNFIFPIAVVFGVYFVNQARALPYHPVSSEWPLQCKGRTYCDRKPSYYPEKAFEDLMDSESEKYNVSLSGSLDARLGDVACSASSNRYPRQIFLIKDSNDRIRFVAQTDKIEILIVLEECREPGRVKEAEYLNKHNTGAYASRLRRDDGRHRVPRAVTRWHHFGPSGAKGRRPSELFS